MSLWPIRTITILASTSSFVLTVFCIYVRISYFLWTIVCKYKLSINQSVNQYTNKDQSIRSDDRAHFPKSYQMQRRVN